MRRRLGPILFRGSAILVFAATVWVRAALANTIGVVKAFPSGGEFPESRLVLAPDGYLYGTTSGGGRNGWGTIFRIDVTGSEPPRTVFEFAGTNVGSPGGGLIVGADGALYGTTYASVFRFDPETSTRITLHAFLGAEGHDVRGELALGRDGWLYGTTFAGGANSVGTIFRIAPDGGGFQTLHSFTLAEGYYSIAGLICARDGFLYGGTTQGGEKGFGMIFRMDRAGTSLVTLHAFQGSGDGRAAASALLQGPDGNLYGVAGGDADQSGVLYRLDTAGLHYTKLHDFGGAGGWNPSGTLTVGSDGLLYGETAYGGDVTSSGTVFRIDTQGGSFATIHSFVGSDGAHPYGGVVQAPGGLLYGTTSSGSLVPTQYGTVFAVGLDGGGFATLQKFGRHPEGDTPQSDLVRASDGFFYGTTSNDGGNYGTIFRTDATGASFETVHRFGWTDGSYPHAGLVAASDGALYGTTSSGGGGGNTGTIFRLDTATLVLTTLHILGAGEGAAPRAALIQASDGKLYGTTSSTVFGLTTDGSVFTVLHTFTGAEGSQSRGRLLQASDGMLYGTTAFGGANGQGTVFRIAPTGASFQTLYSFAGADGAMPYAGVVQGTDGNLYGTTWVGGTSQVGTVFRMNTSGTSLTTIHHFATADGAGPYAVVQGADGLLYGTASVGGGSPACASGCGTVFQVGTDGAGFATVHAFAGWDGAQPESGVLQDGDGTFYGTTSGGGSAGAGAVYRLAACGPDAPPSIVPGGSTALCLGGTVTLDAGGGYARYSWTPNGETTESIVVGAAGDYTVNATDASGCGGTSAPLAVTVAANPSPIIATGACVPPNAAGLQASVDEDPSHTYSWTITGGTIDSGQGTGAITFTSGGAGVAVLLSVSEVTLDGCGRMAEATLQADFGDVPPQDLFHDFVCAVGRAGITVGCGSGDYCRNDPVTRAQMAVFLLKAEHGGGFSPPPCSGVFTDVPCPGAFADWIEQLFAEGITGGCGPQLYCPANPVTRAQMAVFLLKASLSSSYPPPPCTGGAFADVPCAGGAFDPWIEDLAARGITGGCGGGDYCPGAANTRGQMAVFLAKAFDTAP